MAEVKFSAFGFAYLDVGFRPRRSQTMKSIRYKVDSGANCTTIGHDQLSLLGFDSEWIKSGKVLVGDERPTLASGEPIDSCYMVVGVRGTVLLTRCLPCGATRIPHPAQKNQAGGRFICLAFRF